MTRDVRWSVAELLFRSSSLSSGDRCQSKGSRIGSFASFGNVREFINLNEVLSPVTNSPALLSATGKKKIYFSSFVIKRQR
ncbi:hypothetical protein TNCV_4183271 [Trichonephila clavipes]|nr:hypothetical protein TNCV_4183271 [Trichonephila clavipes]